MSEIMKNTSEKSIDFSEWKIDHWEYELSKWVFQKYTLKIYFLCIAQLWLSLILSAYNFKLLLLLNGIKLMSDFNITIICYDSVWSKYIC